MVRGATLGVVGALLSALSACGLSAGSSVPLDVEPASIQPVPSLRGVELTVGSKDFSEQIILGYIAEFALKAAGAKVRDLTNITGSNSGRDALLAGQVDVMWEYTGTGWINYLGHTKPIPDERRQFEAVRQEDAERNGVTWTNLTQLDNTYALAVNQQVAERYGVRTMSDVARLAKTDPAAATFCVDTEFANRDDGFPGVQKAYGFDVPPQNIKVLAIGAVYQATKDAGTCNFGEVFTTDGRILALNLRVLDDDKRFFPRYNAALTMRSELARKYPDIAKVLEPVSKRITSETMMRLNARVDVDGADPADVARDWLVREGFVRKP
ncbi:glycine/betaine ABC transporter substrate-binding protein [Longimycelium tulufanense]|uniref:Glycine/betaine ABC transporter substrate-binding protein n=2 Tax=Longimycelium tulufanense TaxID=907463 RepID=A0A8J3CC56_9PSEU|nr:glycine/betaine ABC transporter substrate-binding protein [Longimycelium tulufanense]